MTTTALYCSLKLFEPKWIRIHRLPGVNRETLQSQARCVIWGVLLQHRPPDAPGEKLIAEASPNDKKWGTGLQKGLTLIPRLWRGSNVLGWALMEVRQLIRAETEAPVLTYPLHAGSQLGSAPISIHNRTTISQNKWLPSLRSSDDIARTWRIVRPRAPNHASISCSAKTKKLLWEWGAH